MNEATTQPVVFSYSGLDVAQHAHQDDDAVELVEVTVNVPAVLVGQPARDGRPFIEPVTNGEAMDSGASDSWWIATGATGFEQIGGVPVPIVEFVEIDELRGDGDFDARLLLDAAKPGKAGELVSWWLDLWADRNDHVRRVWIDREGMIRRRVNIGATS